MTVRKFIHALGGPLRLAEELNTLPGVTVTAKNVGIWSTRDCIPLKWRWQVSRVAKRLNVPANQGPRYMMEYFN